MSLKKSCSLIFLIIVITAMKITAQSEKFCRFEKDGSSYYGKYEENMIHQLEREPWFGIEFTGITYEIAEVKLLYPSEPKKIIGLVKAYKQAWQEKTPPKFVRWFLKPASSASSDYDKIILPSAFDQIKVECELTIIIGKEIKDADEKEAEAAIFGFTVGNDIMGYDESFVKYTGDTLEYKDPSLAAALKIGDRFAPFGPIIITNYEWKNKSFYLTILNPNEKKEILYNDNTNNLLYSPTKIVSDLSKILTLYPGDIIMTGTSKSFVGGDGDIVTVEIEGLGKLTNYISVKRN